MNIKHLRLMLLSIIALLSSGWNCQSAYADKWVQTNPSDLKSNDVVDIVATSSETQEWTFRDFGIDMVNVLTKEQQVDGTSYEF